MNFCNNKRTLKGITAFCPAESPSPHCQWIPGGNNNGNKRMR